MYFIIRNVVGIGDVLKRRWHWLHINVCDGRVWFCRVFLLSYDFFTFSPGSFKVLGSNVDGTPPNGTVSSLCFKRFSTVVFSLAWAHWIILDVENYYCYISRLSTEKYDTKNNFYRISWINLIRYSSSFFYCRLLFFTKFSLVWHSVRTELLIYKSSLLTIAPLYIATFNFA